MLKIFVHTHKHHFYKLISFYLKKPYKPNTSTITINLETKQFQKVLEIFKPQKVTYETITFYTKLNEPIREMVSSDFNILIFNSEQEMNSEIQKIKTRDKEIIEDYLNSKSINKNPSLRSILSELQLHIDNYPNLDTHQLARINYQYKEVITQLSLLSIKSHLIIIDEEIEDISKTIVKYPLSLYSELLDIPQQELDDFLKLYDVDGNIMQKVELLVNLIKETVLNYWTIFYTANNREARQYLIPTNTNVHKASEKIHTEIAQKFIQAEVFNVDEIQDIKTLPFKSFGKSYIVKNHDFILIKTS
ncbi:MAG: DUF933 domain-containing protein [bacterium]